jgi:hypothetical protein
LIGGRFGIVREIFRLVVARSPERKPVMMTVPPYSIDAGNGRIA